MTTTERRRWKKKPEPSGNITFVAPPKKDLGCSEPINYFFKFIDEEILEIFHYQSNLKSVQKGKPSSITKDEIKVFLGITMMMGYHHVPSIQHYWSSHSDLGLTPIKDAMT